MRFIRPGRDTGRLYGWIHGATVIGAIKGKALNEVAIPRREGRAHTGHVRALRQAAHGHQARIAFAPQELCRL